MKKLSGLIAFSLLAALAMSAGPPADQHIQATLQPADGSGVSGTVELTQLPKGSNIIVHAKGLQPGAVYASFYYESATCTEPADLLGTFTATAAGGGEVRGHIDDDLDEVGSVSVRVGPGYGTLLACAVVH